MSAPQGLEPEPAAGRGSGRRLNPSLVVGGVLVAASWSSWRWCRSSGRRTTPRCVDPTSRLLTPSAQHWLGTDKFGRDVLSQIMVGSRTTLFVGFVAVGVAARDRGAAGHPRGDGAALGRRGRLMRGNDLLLAFPALLLAIMFGAVFGASTLTAMVAIGIATVPSFARVVRSGGAAGDAHRVRPGRPRGRPAPRVDRRCGTCCPTSAAWSSCRPRSSFAIAVLAEAALSFLGFGTPPPTPSWGRMLQESQELLFSAPRLAVFPGVAIALAVLGFNLLGDGLRDRYDPRLEDRR